MVSRSTVIACGAAVLGSFVLGASRVQAQSAAPQSMDRQPAPRAAAAQPASARRQGPPLERIVSLTLVKVRLDTALDRIAALADVPIVYTDQVVPVARVISATLKDVSVRRALEVVLRGTGVAAEVRGDRIVLRRPDAGAVDTGETGAILGRVRDSVTARPVKGVLVSIGGTALTATTNDSGAFWFAKVPAGMHQLTARMVGYMVAQREVVVQPGRTVGVELALRMSMTRLQEVVTTATGPRRRMDLPNDVAVLNVDSIVATQPVTSVTDLLATRVPGLVVQHTSGAPGDPARLRLRGVNSISRGNDPIVIVDGVRVYYDQSGIRAQNLTQGAERGYAAPSPLDQLDVHSIETIEVVKGPSAATLYGADAANGVIVITTKKGRPGPARWRVSASQGLSSMPGRYPDQYLRFAHDYGGNAFICRLSRNCAAGVDSLVRFQALNDPALTVLGQGRSTSLALGVDGGTSGLSYSLTGSYDDETGILKLPGAEVARFESLHGSAPPSWMRRPQTLTRWSGTGRVTAQLGPKADASFTTTLTRETQQRSSLEAQLAQLMSTYVDRGTQTYYQVNDIGGYQPVSALVPDFYQRATDVATNFTNAASLNWRPRAWLTASVDGGLNVIARTDEVLLPRGMLDTLGSLATARGSSVVSTVNVRALATRALPLGFTFQFALGANYTKTAIADLSTSVTGLAQGTTGLTGAAQVSPPSETVSEVTSAGWYVAPALSHKRFFLDAGLRFDGGSTYGSHVSLPTFPKLGGSWLISDEPWFPFKRVFNTLRLRAAYGHAGVQPGLADKLRLYTVSTGFVDGIGASVTTIGASTLGNTELKPERSTELEGGFDADLWEDRISVTLSGYRKIRKDALLQVPVAPSVYGNSVTVWKNIGVVRNTGLEATVTTQLVRTDPVTWSWTLGVSRNRNLVVSLAPGMQPINLGDGQRVAAGYPLFGHWAKPIKGYLDVNGDGIIQLGEVQV
ncbi:MAG: TonB-dependent receptor, partial [Gemmatimonadaceae bacterium]|nr:TonB-dependent receptor [Gemmatimonadaceae bacterium]